MCPMTAKSSLLTGINALLIAASFAACVPRSQSELDMYAMPLDAVLARASDLGLNLSSAHTGLWNNRDVFVAGALAGDTLSPQVWFDREHMYPVRLIQRAWSNPTVYDWHISNHLNIGGGWIEREIALYSGGRLLVRETYDSVMPRQRLPDSLFLPEPYRPPEWVRGSRSP